MIAPASHLTSYKSAGLATVDVLAGHVPMMFGGPSSLAQHVATGRLRASVVTGEKRISALPDVPTFIESGLNAVDTHSFTVVACFDTFGTMTVKINGWGLIGTGRIANDRILPGINAFAGNKLMAVVSRDQARADAFAKKFGAQHAYTNYADMLRNSAVTVVAIETPSAQHAEQAVAAARAGKHVFCDKPMATNVDDAERVVKECEQAGVKLGVNFHNRFIPCFIETKRIIDSGEIGEVLLIQLEASPGARPESTSATWRVDPAMAGLGTTMSIGVHVYDILRYMLSSEIVQVSAFFDTPRGVMEQTNLSTFRFANGVMAQLNVNEKAPQPYNDFVIYGTKGRITGRGLTRSRLSGELQVKIGGGETRRTEFPAINADAMSVAAFSQALLDGRAPSPSGIDGLRSVQLTDAMAQSAWDSVHVKLAYY